MAKILLVDDDPDVVEAETLFLEAAGHKVVAAYNRADGMAAVAAEKPDLLILDIMMEQPDDGIAMAQDLRRQGCALPILMLSSIGKVTNLEYGKDDAIVPADDFLEKPVEPDTLVEKVNALLAGKG